MLSTLPKDFKYCQWEVILKLSKYKIVRTFVCVVVCFLAVGCKTMPVKNSEAIEANVFFKRVMKNAELMK